MELYLSGSFLESVFLLQRYNEISLAARISIFFELFFRLVWLQGNFLFKIRSKKENRLCPGDEVRVVELPVEIILTVRSGRSGEASGYSLMAAARLSK